MAEAKAIGALLKEGWRPRRTHRVRELGRRGAGPARLHGMGGDARRGAAQEGGRCNQLRYQRARIPPARAAAIRCRRFVNEVVARRRRTRRPGVTVRERARAAIRVAGIGDAKDEDARKPRSRGRRGHSARRAGLWLGLHALPAAPRHRLAQSRLTAARTTGRRLPLALRHLRPLPAFRRSRTSRTASPRRRPRVAWCCACGQADVLPLEFGGFASAVREYRDELGTLVEERRKKSQALAELLEAHAFELAADPTRPVGPPQPHGRGARTSISRRSTTPSHDSRRARKPTTRRAPASMRAP